MNSSKYNISPKVADALTAYLVLHYPLLKTLRSGGLAIRRLKTAVVHAGAAIADLLAWSSHRATYKKPAPTPRKEPPTPMHKETSSESKIIDHQRSVINQLMLHSKRQDERMNFIEAKQEGGYNSRHEQEASARAKEKTKRRRTSVTHLHATWFAWYAQEPFGLADAPKRQRSNAKQLVAFMKLFVADDLKLDPSAVNYRDQVLALGKQAEAAVLAFLGRLEIKLRGSTAVRKHLHDLYQRGALNDKITRLQQLRSSAAVQDPDRQDGLELVAST